METKPPWGVPLGVTRHYAKVLALCADQPQEEVMERLVRHLAKGTCPFGCKLVDLEETDPTGRRMRMARYAFECPVGLGLADAAAGINWITGAGLPDEVRRGH